MRALSVIILSALATSASAAPLASPLRAGFYATVGMSCAAAAKSYDKGVAVRNGGFEFNDGARDIAVITKTGATTYRFTFVIENEMGQKTKLPSIVTIDPKGFSERLNGKTEHYLFCSPNVPKNWGI